MYYNSFVLLLFFLATVKIVILKRKEIENRQIILFNLVFLSLILMTHILSQIFANFTNGLIVTSSSGIDYIFTSDYLSSGSDDDVISGFLLFFVVPVVVRLINLKKTFSIFEFATIFFLQIIYIIFIFKGIELGSIWYTVYCDKNIFLFLFFLSLSLFYIYVTVLFIFKILKSQ